MAQAKRTAITTVNVVGRKVETGINKLLLKFGLKKSCYKQAPTEQIEP
jgi:hypothetical protein